MIRKMLKMQLLEDEDDLAYETEKKQRTNSTPDSQPAWMRTLHTTACNWLQLIPQTLNHLKRTVENIKVINPLQTAPVLYQQLNNHRTLLSHRSLCTSAVLLLSYNRTASNAQPR